MHVSKQNFLPLHSACGSSEIQLYFCTFWNLASSLACPDCTCLASCVAFGAQEYCLHFLVTDLHLHAHHQLRTPPSEDSSPLVPSLEVFQNQATLEFMPSRSLILRQNDQTYLNFSSPPNALGKGKSYKGVEEESESLLCRRARGGGTHSKCLLLQCSTRPLNRPVK